MRYWGYLIAKFCLVLAVFSGFWIGMVRWIPAPATFNYQMPNRLGQDLTWTLAIMVLFLLFCGATYLIYWDQRLRCRTCLRRLRMPVSKGSWTNVLLGPPRTEYICLYGHGTLLVPELQRRGSVCVSALSHLPLICAQ